MNKLSTSKRSQIVHLLVEGNSLRATARLAHIDYNTVLSLLVKVGDACAEYQYMALRNLPCKRMQVDEIWSFVGCKQKNTQKVKNPRKDIGDIWTFTSLCPDTKIVPAWLVGHRDSMTATDFIRDLYSAWLARYN